MQIKFSKYQGTGNDFVIIDNRKGDIQLTKKQIALMCHRRFGIGADGLMLLNHSDNYDFEMMYYNADGAEGSMCGNGGRCLTKFAFDCGIIKEQYTFIASDGPHEACFGKNQWIHLKMIDVHTVSKYNADFVLNTGSPHYIKFVTNINELNVLEIGRSIRYSDHFNAKGINVNFVEVLPDKIIVRTYERGVEDETYSCGTGVTAASVTCATKIGYNRIEVETMGGQLAVEFNKIDEAHFKNIWLCGPAEFVFNGAIDI